MAKKRICSIAQRQIEKVRGGRQLNLVAISTTVRMTRRIESTMIIIIFRFFFWYFSAFCNCFRPSSTLTCAFSTWKSIRSTRVPCKRREDMELINSGNIQKLEMKISRNILSITSKHPQSVTRRRRIFTER